MIRGSKGLGEFDPANPRRGLGGLRPGGFLALFADGGVHLIPNGMDDDIDRNLMSRRDGNRIDRGDFGGGSR